MVRHVDVLRKSERERLGGRGGDLTVTCEEAEFLLPLLVLFKHPLLDPSLLVNGLLLHENPEVVCVNNLRRYLIPVQFMNLSVSHIRPKRRKLRPTIWLPNRRLINCPTTLEWLLAILM